jgi:glycosyltransferase involved in cell wall biosynthesis
MQRVACVLPALNAAAALDEVVVGLRSSLAVPFVVIVDDGSRDDTHAVALRVGDAVVRFRQNRGKGAALRAGFAVALEHAADVVVTIDADGQHDPAYAPGLVAATRDADLVVGARARRGGTMPIGRRLTNALSAAAVARCIGQPVPDAQSGYRAMRTGLLRSIEARGDRYEFETEFLILAARRGYRVGFVPIPTRYDVPVASQFRPLRDSARIIGTLWRFNTGLAL